MSLETETFCGVEWNAIARWPTLQLLDMEVSDLGLKTLMLEGFESQKRSFAELCLVA